MEILRSRGAALVKEYLRYKTHVCREEYATVEAWEERRRDQTENEWPEYRNCVSLVSQRQYLLDGNQDAEEWLDNYLLDHVQEVQEKKQHRVHVMNAKGERVPLAHC